MSAHSDTEHSPRIGHELRPRLRLAGEELHGSVAIVPEMYVPGTECLRTSILATWTDMIAGLLVGHAIAPRVPVTLDLAIDLYREPIGCEHVNGAGRVLKAGRSVAVVGVDFTTGKGERLATSTVSFMRAPDTTLTLRPLEESLADPSLGSGRLTMPLARRLRCERREPGVAELPRSDAILNASNTVNGGLIAVVVEEAALSHTPGATLLSLAMRYLRPARVGPLVATAAVHDRIARVDVRDAGDDDRLAVVATTRTSRTAPH